MMMKLDTDRLILRPVEREDRDAVLCYINNFEVSKWLSRVAYPYGEEQVDEFLSAVIDDGRPPIARPFAITFKNTPDEMIGCIGLEPRRLDDGHYSATAEFGYWLGEPHWGKGIVSEAAFALVRMGFRCAGYEKLTARHYLENDRSKRILEKCGFVDIGSCETYCLARDETMQSRQLVLTRERWQART